MMNKNYIHYLNTLNNVSANSENTIAEVSQNSEFYDYINVDRPVSQFIVNCILNEKPNIIIITGHAGDGKTSILIQVLNKLNSEYGRIKDRDEIEIVQGKKCYYVKDFSEFSEEDRRDILEECKEKSYNGIFSILVANTGPLLETVAEVFSAEEQSQFINAIDNNTGEINNIDGYAIRVINVADLDNSSFVSPFIEKIISEKCFERCNNCPKLGACPIWFNRELIKDNQASVIQFLRNHYIWQQEYNSKITIRQIIAQITYAITSGLECEDVRSEYDVEYLFNNLFSNTLFGYSGINPNIYSREIKAIYNMYTRGYDNKPIYADEDLFIIRKYSSVSEKLNGIIESITSRHFIRNLLGWQKAIRRMYILFNLEVSNDKIDKLNEDVFSKMFPRYLKIRSGESPNISDKNLIVEALAIINSGYSNRWSKEIILTLKRSMAIEQSVHFVHGTVQNKSIRLISANCGDSKFGEEEKKQIMIRVYENVISHPISLPLLNYFEEVTRGIISTNIDPQLSQGIDMISAQLITLVSSDVEKYEIEMIVMGTQKASSINLFKENNNWFLS